MTPDEQRQIVLAYRKLFKTPNGKIVMADMKRRWMDNKLVGATDTETVANAAIHDVIQTIINFATMELPDE